MSTAAEIFEKINQAAQQNPEGATAVDGIFQFNITGDGGGTWVINLKKGVTSGFVSTEPNPDAAATVIVDAADWSAMIKGELDPMSAFMGGKIKIEGDMTAAMKLPGVMKLAR
jgi:putative sterol carrier protein